jgi:Flp pilus assembly protein TadD
MTPTRWLSFAGVLGFLAVGSAAVQPAAAQSTPPTSATDPTALVSEGRKLTVDGKLDEAMEKLDRALKLDSKSFDAHLQRGITLDIRGDYAGARKDLDEALALAQDDGREPVLNAIAVSYVFEGDIANAARYYQKVFDRQIAANTLDAAAATANALGRIYLETGDVAKAEQWYVTGRDTAGKINGLPGDQVDLWAMRWHHAKSRIASRKGDRQTAEREAMELQTLVEKNTINGQQLSILTYLKGYNAFYGGDIDTAIAVLSKADQRDPFILGLLAQAYEKKGDLPNAKATYTKAAGSSAHSLQNALTRGTAKKRLAGIS